MTTTDTVNEAILAKAKAKAHQDVVLVIKAVTDAISLPTKDDAKQPSNFRPKYGGFECTTGYASGYHHGADSMKRYEEFVKAFNSFTHALEKERVAFLHEQMVKDLLEKVTLLG